MKKIKKIFHLYMNMDKCLRLIAWILSRVSLFDCLFYLPKHTGNN